MIALKISDTEFPKALASYGLMRHISLRLFVAVVQQYRVLLGATVGIGKL